MKNTYIILIIVLIVVGFILGYAIYQRSTSISAPPLQPRSNGEESGDSPSSPDQLEQTLKLTLEDGSVVELSNPNVSKQASEDFAAAIENIGKAADRLEVNPDCTLSPPVVRVREALPFTFKNKDTAEHQITILSEKVLVPAQGEETIVAQFENPGIFGIGCDGLEVGYMEIVEIESE